MPENVEVKTDESSDARACSDAQEKVFHVEAPLVGKVCGSVKAATEGEALKRFIMSLWNVEFKLDDEEEFVEFMECEEVEILEQVNRGNVVHGPLGQAYVEELE